MLTHLRAIVMVDVEFNARDDRRLCCRASPSPKKNKPPCSCNLQLGWTCPPNAEPPPRFRAAPPPEG